MPLKLGTHAFLAVKQETITELKPPVQNAINLNDAMQMAVQNVARWAKTHFSEADFNDCNVRSNLDNFLKDFIDRNLGPALQEHHYENMLDIFTKIHHSLVNNINIQASQKITIFKSLIKQLSVCPPGRYSSIQIIREQLQAKVGIPAWLEKFRFEIITLTIANELQERLYPQASGMQTHVTDECLRYARNKGYNLPTDDSDNHDVSLDVNLVTFTESDEEYFDKRMADLYSANTIINAMIADFSIHVFTEVAAARKNAAGLSYVEFSRIIQGRFALVSDNIPADVLFSYSDDEKVDPTDLHLSDVRLQIKTTAEFQKAIRPYILVHLLSRGMIEQDNLTLLSLRENDVLHNHDLSSENSFVKTRYGLLPFQTYFAIPENAGALPGLIKKKFALVDVASETANLKQLIVDYNFERANTSPLTEKLLNEFSMLRRDYSFSNIWRTTSAIVKLFADDCSNFSRSLLRLLPLNAAFVALLAFGPLLIIPMIFVWPVKTAIAALNYFMRTPHYSAQIQHLESVIKAIESCTQNINSDGISVIDQRLEALVALVNMEPRQGFFAQRVDEAVTNVQANIANKLNPLLLTNQTPVDLKQKGHAIEPIENIQQSSYGQLLRGELLIHKSQDADETEPLLKRAPKALAAPGHSVKLFVGSVNNQPRASLGRGYAAIRALSK